MPNPSSQRPGPRPGGWHRLLLCTLGLGLCLCAAGSPSEAGTEERRHLTSDQFGQWERIGGFRISPDGRWFAHVIRRIDERSWVSLTRTDGGGDPLRFEAASGFDFTDDSRWFLVREPLDSDDADNRGTQLTTVDLQTGDITRHARISSYQLARGAGVVLGTVPAERRDADHPGLELLHLESGDRKQLGHVLRSSLSPDGRQAALVLGGSDPEAMQRLAVVDLDTLEVRELEGPAYFASRPQWHPDDDRVAVFRRTTSDAQPSNTELAVYGTTKPAGPLHVLDDRWKTLCPVDACALGKRVSGIGELRWADEGRQLVFGVSAVDPAAASGDEVSELAVWHWRDDPLPPRRQRDGTNALAVAAWAPGPDQLTTLTTLNPHRSVRLLSGERHLLVQDAMPYRPHFRERWRDFYAVDLRDGRQFLAVARQEAVHASAAGHYLLYFRDNHWWTMDLTTQQRARLTEGLDARFNDYTRVSGREQDQPFGHGQWGEDDRWVLLYGRHDVFRVSPDGREAERLTDGRDAGIRFRHHRLGWHADPPRDDTPLYFSTVNERDKSQGYLRVQPDGSSRWLIQRPGRLRFLHQAQAANAYIMMAESATESPNFYFTEDDFSTLRRITDTNPQQANFHWADDELIHYQSRSGHPLQGRLLYPADYRPDRRYPMVVIIYEERSENLHSYNPPNLGGLFNQRVLSSEGYFVLEPDIAYELNRPGLSAMESLIPAVEAALATEMIDPDAVALVGHSWGGYQTAFAITQTDLFRAAIAAAPVTNLVSQYNAVYRRTGQPNANIFETGQGRLTRLFWETPEPYLANSPVFHAHRASSPLLIVFGTDDQAVDFSQGVELYNVMRRAERPVVMLAYEDERHSFRERSNREDATRRKLQWLDHHLRNQPSQQWMLGSVPTRVTPLRSAALGQQDATRH